VEDGTIQQQLADQAYRVHKKFESGELTKVGVNRFRSDEGDHEVEVFEVDPETRARQIARLHRIKNERNRARVEETLDALKQAAADQENLMPYLLDAVRAYATLGEIVQQLKEIHGEANPATVF
jgi:methylmalonyl-CoA mutase N-terminal domain/subunit